jgi:hypothetical protein
MYKTIVQPVICTAITAMLLCVTVVLGAFMEVDEVLKGTVTFSV